MSFARIAELSTTGSLPVVPDMLLVGSRTTRLRAIDAARGAAMVLVCLSHFAAAYVTPAGGDAPGGWLQFIGHVASPMFFIISGAMVGYLYASRPDSFRAIRGKMATRAVFFLTVGHLLILGAVVHTLIDLAHVTRMLFVTDTIAIALLVSPRLLTIRPWIRVVGAGAVYAVATALVYAWQPTSLSWHIVKDTLVGSDGPSFWVYNVPLLPWLAVHAAGTVLGGRLATSARDGVKLERYLASLGLALVAAAAVLRVACWFLLAGPFAYRGEAARIARHLASPWNRLPPAPAHMLLFGGVALVAIAAVFVAERLQLFVKLMAWLALLGEASAFVFVLEFYVFYIFVPKWVPVHLALAPLVFLGAMLFVGATASVWLNRRRLARQLWFGITASIWPTVKR